MNIKTIKLWGNLFTFLTLVNLFYCAYLLQLLVSARFWKDIKILLSSPVLAVIAMVDLIVIVLYSVKHLRQNSRIIPKHVLTNMIIAVIGFMLIFAVLFVLLAVIFSRIFYH